MKIKEIVNNTVYGVVTTSILYRHVLNTTLMIIFITTLHLMKS